MKIQLNEIQRMQKLAGLLTEDENQYVPYQINDERGKELYFKYAKSYDNPAWDYVDGNYVKEIDLKTLLNITGMTMDELKELSSNYGDESFTISIDGDTVTEYND
jgi:hypothetical protein